MVKNLSLFITFHPKFLRQPSYQTFLSIVSSSALKAFFGRHHWNFEGNVRAKQIRPIEVLWISDWRESPDPTDPAPTG